MFTTETFGMARKSVIFTGALLFLKVMMTCEASTQVNWLAVTDNDDQGFWTIFVLCDILYNRDGVQYRYNNMEAGAIYSWAPVGLFSHQATNDYGEMFQIMPLRKSYNESELRITSLIRGKVYNSSQLEFLCLSGGEFGLGNVTWSEIANKRRDTQNEDGLLSCSCDEDNIHCVVECHSRNTNITSLMKNEDDISTNFMNATQVFSSNNTEEIQNRVLLKNSTSITAFVTFTGPEKHLQCKTESSLIVMEVSDDSAAATSTPPPPPPGDPTALTTVSSSHVHKGQKYKITWERNCLMYHVLFSLCCRGKS